VARDLAALERAGCAVEAVFLDREVAGHCGILPAADLVAVVGDEDAQRGTSVGRRRRGSLVAHNRYQVRGGEDAAVARDLAALERAGCAVEA
jgi:hypothetical protein